jgi:hypothetical protein
MSNTSSDRQPTCAERLPQHLASRLSDFTALTTLAQVYGEEITPELREMAADQDLSDAAESSEDLAEAAQERIYEYPLGLSTLRVHRVELSTGGPADFLEVFVDEDGDISRIVYHFQDWFDGAERTLSGDEFTAAESFVTALIPEL